MLVKYKYHSQILKTPLVIVYHYLFQSREVFCQLVQQMKNQNSENKMKNQASIFIGTWNMGNTDSKITF